jgi:hypothetical protein
MQGNYFLNAMGELVQRMVDPDAEYGLAFPDVPRFRRLVEQSPRSRAGCPSTSSVPRRRPGQPLAGALAGVGCSSVLSEGRLVALMSTHQQGFDPVEEYEAESVAVMQRSLTGA